MKIAVYPGSFDPFTLGHLDILEQAAPLYDEICVAILKNSAKRSFFKIEEKAEIIRCCVEAKGLRNVTISSFDGLLIDFCQKLGAGYIIRGLRTITDFEYEQQIHSVNWNLDRQVHTVYFMSNPEYSFLSSSIVRELGSLGADITPYVPAGTVDYLQRRLMENAQ